MNQFQFLIALGALGLVTPHGTALPEPARVSLIQDRGAGAPARYGLEKVKAALEAKGIRCEEPAGVQAAHGDFLIVAGVPSKAGPAAELAQSFGITAPSAPESQLIRNLELSLKPPSRARISIRNST